MLTASAVCGKYFAADRGLLTFDGIQLRFENEEHCVFDVPLSEIQKLVWHWYSFGAAFEATVAGRSYFLSFIPRQPSLGQWSSGLSTGVTWRAALESAICPDGPSSKARAFHVVLRLALITGCVACIWISTFAGLSDSLLVIMLGMTVALLSVLGIIALLGQSLLDIAVARRSKG